MLVSYAVGALTPNKSYSLPHPLGTSQRTEIARTGAAIIAIDADIAALESAVAAKASPGDVDTRIAALVGAAPAALDTLKEIADQLASDQDAVSALTALVSNKADSSALATALAAITALQSTMSDAVARIAALEARTGWTG